MLTRASSYNVHDHVYAKLLKCCYVPQNIEFHLPCPLEVFEMLVVPEHPYPLICMGVSKGAEFNQVVCFETLDPNSTSPWFEESGKIYRGK